MLEPGRSVGTSCSFYSNTFHQHPAAWFNESSMDTHWPFIVLSETTRTGRQLQGIHSVRMLSCRIWSNVRKSRSDVNYNIAVWYPHNITLWFGWFSFQSIPWTWSQFRHMTWALNKKITGCKVTSGDFELISRSMIPSDSCLEKNSSNRPHSCSLNVIPFWGGFSH